ncbi:Glycoside hydrolase family 76 protein [Mycena venus]|uniref:Glycoside hydrolase family 76 protein n=1 Tax=Mycena venus TaxID=2733690 RepID=A0A8H6YZN7_9AGAR|nr:Glycoside hydrolase family 76 protein [Mycena venus]
MVAASNIVTSSWRDPDVTLPSTQRIHLASSALEQSVLIAQTAEAGRSSVFHAMAEFDIATRQTTYKNALSQSSIAADIRGTSFVQNTQLTDMMDFGLAAIRAYAVYNDQTYLDLAIEAWQYVSPYTISAVNTVSASIVVKNFSLETTCQGESMLGGTFDTNNAGDPSITGIASTSFFVLSAFLAETNSSSVYLNAALDSLHFITSHILSGSLVQTGMTASHDNPCVLNSTADASSTGLLIRGLAVLYSMANNATIQSLLENVTEAAISNDEWHSSEGILTQGGSNLVVGFTEAFSRNATSAELRTYMHDFMGVQFNAVVDLATFNETNVYAGDWTGPPSAQFLQSNQTSAISALLGGIFIDDSLPSFTVPDAAASPYGKQRGTRAGVIAGSVVGSIVVLAITGSAILFTLRRRARIHPPTSPGPQISSSPVQPFPISIPQAAMLLRSQSIAKTGAISPIENPSQSPGGDNTLDVAVEPSNGVPGETLTPLQITELVRMLSERLSRMPAQEWHQTELPPPEYGASDTQA